MNFSRIFSPPARTSQFAGLLVLIFLFGGGCGQRASQVDQATRDKIMLVGNGGEPPDLDPQTITGTPEIAIAATLFEGLTRNDPETLEARPGVAERWDVSVDGLIYTFHLRADAKWSDG